MQSKPIFDSAVTPMVPGTWADGPIPLISTIGITDDIPAGHSCIEIAREMAAAHNVLLRGLNAAYNQAYAVEKGTPEAAGFIDFNQCLQETIHHHHFTEEEWIFPALEKVTNVPGFCDGNLEQHRIFETAAEKYKEYVNSVKAEDYDGVKLRALINAFATPLATHLNDEIKSLIALKDYDSAGVWKAMDDARLASLGAINTHRQLPLVLMCQDATFLIDNTSSMLAIPWYLPYLANYYFSRQHAGAWQFGPSDYWGRRKTLKVEEA